MNNSPFEGFGTFICLLPLGIAAVLATRRHQGDIRIQLRIFVVAYIVRFATSLLIYTTALSKIIGDEDATGWVAGSTLADKWVREGMGFLDLPGACLGAFSGQNKGYTYLLGSFFFGTGIPYRLVAAALNCFFGALTAVFAYRVARTLFSERVAARVGWWTCFFPSLIIWSAQTVKEPIVILLETVALYGCLRLRESGLSPRHLVLCIVAIIAMYPFRFYATYLVSLAVLISLVGPGLTGWKGKLAGVAMLILLVPLSTNLVSKEQYQAQVEQASLDRVQFFRTAVARGGREVGAGSGVETVDVRSPGGLITGVSVGAVHLLLAPFPWQLKGSARALLTLPELIVWWWLVFVGVLPGAAYLIRHRFRDITILLLFLIGFGFLYSLMFGNVGLIFRQRAQLLPWLLIFAAVGLERRRLRRRAAGRALVPLAQCAPDGHAPSAGFSRTSAGTIP